jgi:predicted phosphatase
MSNKRQTAVDWHHEKVSNLIEMLKRKYVNQDEFLGGLMNLRDQAKEMEKEQTKNAYWLGTINYNSENDAEQYYNETYNTNEP